GFQRVRLAIDAFGIHVDQAHHHGGQRVLEVAFTRITAAYAAAGCQPLLLRTPVGVLFGVPDVLATKAEAEGFQTHRFIGHVAGQHDQVGPADAVAVLFLDRPQEAPRLVEVGVVGPGTDGCEALVAGAGTTTAIGDA